MASILDTAENLGVVVFVTKEQKETLEALIPSLVNEVDWEVILSVLRVLKWKWKGEVPTLEMVRSVGDELLRGSVQTSFEMGGIGLGSLRGGLEGYVFKDDEGEYHLGIRLIACDWTTESFDVDLDEPTSDAGGDDGEDWKLNS